MRFGNYSARSFAIPHLDSGERGSHAACGSGVVDGFFQLDADVRNDLPILEVTVPASGAPSVAHRAAGTCSEFVTEQMTAVNGGRGNGGYWLDSQGVLRRGLPSHTTGRNYRTQRWSLSSDTYQGGRFRIDESVTSGSYGFGGYAARIDYYTGSASLANAEFRGAGNVSFAVPHSIELVVNTQKSGSVFTWTPRFPASAGVNAASAVHLQARDYLSLCPSSFHPRGEDAARRIGNGTGRTLSSLTDATKTRLADQYWCRSDARKQIWYEPEFTSRTCGPDPRPTCPAGVTVPTKEFQAYGRVGCFFTATYLDTTSMQRGTRAIQGTQKNTCSYMYPMPQCTENGTKKPIARAKLDSLYVAPINSPGVFPFASDGSTACDTNPRCTDGGSKRDMTDAELQAYRTARGASFVPASDGSTPCTAAVAASAAADFTAVACVTAILEIYENRPKGFDAEPGVRADHRTVTADAANPVFDLDVAAAHPGTASPPRSSGDPSGCADGSEGRADHGTAGSAARKNSSAEDAATAATKGLPKSSAAVNSQHPPHSKNFGSAGTDYTGAVRNMAHRYASDAAENSCAAAREFAELVLEILKGRRLVFQSYIDSYEATIDTAIADYSSYSPTIQAGSENSANAYNNLSLEEMRQNALERQREKYVKDRAAYLAALKAALTNAETEYGKATDSTKLVLTAADANGCINSYKTAITALNDLAEAAETAFPSTAVARDVTLTRKGYDITGNQQAADLTHGTDGFMRLYNALSLESYTDLVPGYTVTSSPESDARPADSNLTWTLGDWSLPTRTYSCAYLWASRYFQETYGGSIQCVKRRQDRSPVNISCPTGYRYKDGWPPKCSRQDEDGEEERTSVTYSCNSGWTRIINPDNPFQYICTQSVVDSTRTAQTRDLYKRTDNYRNVVSGTVTGTLAGTTGKKADFSRTYTGDRECRYATVNFTSNHPSALRSLAARTAPECDTGTAINHDLATGTTKAAAEATVKGTAHSVTLPSEAQMTTARPAALAAVTESSLLGKLYPTHSSRANLKAASAAVRNTAANSLGTLTQSGGGSIVVPSGFAAAINTTVGTSAYAAGFAPPASTAQRTAIATAATNYINEYAKAYQTAYNQATSDMGSTAAATTWDNFAWSYHTPSLAWGGYLADEGQPARSRGCYLIDVAGDGKVTVQTARMDFESGQYAVGETYSQLFSGDRNCKIRRTRTPQLNMEYQPGNPAGTDKSLAAGYFHTDYQPNPADERFKLAAETEIFTVRAKVADSPPVFCGTTLPADGYLSRTAGQMPSVPAAIAKDSWRTAAQLTTTVLRPSSDASAVTEDHCFARPRLTAADRPRLVVFDDTAHSDMNLVYLQKDPTDTTGINLFTGGPFTKYATETYRYPGDNSQQNVFYGAIWEPPDALGSSTGWNILDDNNPNTDLNTKIKNRIVARDKPATPNLPAIPASQTFKYASAMGFNIGFLDCRPDVENVEFVGNITNATQASNQANNYAGITVPNNRQTPTSKALESVSWYYPPWRLIKGQTRTPASQEPGTTIAEGADSGIYTHPQTSRYGWVIETVNHIGIDKQPIAAFRNFPDVKHADPNRPATVSLAEHQRVCLGDRDSIPQHYRSAAASLPPDNKMRDTLGYPGDPNPQQAMIVWSEHNPICDGSDVCDRWETRCYRNIETPRIAEQVEPCTASPPAGIKRYDDKDLVDANIKRVIADSDLADDPDAAAEAAELISGKAQVFDGEQYQPRWPWLSTGEKIFECDSLWWYCLRTAVTLYGIDQFEWLQTRQLRIAFQYPLPKWGNVLVSTLDRETQNEQAVKVAVNILVQKVRIGS